MMPLSFFKRALIVMSIGIGCVYGLSDYQPALKTGDKFIFTRDFKNAISGKKDRNSIITFLVKGRYAHGDTTAIVLSVTDSFISSIHPTPDSLRNLKLTDTIQFINGAYRWDDDYYNFLISTPPSDIISDTVSSGDSIKLNNPHGLMMETSYSAWLKNVGFVCKYAYFLTEGGTWDRIELIMFNSHEFQKNYFQGQTSKIIAAHFIMSTKHSNIPVDNKYQLTISKKELSINNGAGLKSIEIIDLTGKKIYASNVNSKHFITAVSCSKGVYLVKLSGSDNSITTSKITVKE